MRKASWIVLTVVGALTLLASLASARLAYSKAPDPLTLSGLTTGDVAQGRAEVETALRARRGTAAAFASAYAVLYLGVVLGPYRRGDKGSWWALLAGALALAAVSALRIPTLGTQAGVGAAVVHGVMTLIGLLVDVRRLRGAAA